MKLATTTADYRRYFKTHQERIDNICEAGFKYIDLSMYQISENDELILSDKWEYNTKTILENTKRKSAEFVQAHLPGGNPISDDESHIDELVKITTRAIDVCGVLGISNAAIHLGCCKGISKEESFKRNKRFFEKLFPAMERNNVNVLCENSTVKNMLDMYYPNSGADIKEFIEYVNHPLLHACWDTGHGNCEGNQYDDILDIGNDLLAVHINDNSGQGDEHVLPYIGTMNIDEIMNALIDIGYKGYFTFECGMTFRSAGCWLGKRRSFEKNTRLLEPSLYLQKQFEKLMYDMGKHILTAYDCFEE